MKGTYGVQSRLYGVPGLPEVDAHMQQSWHWGDSHVYLSCGRRGTLIWPQHITVTIGALSHPVYMVTARPGPELNTFALLELADVEQFLVDSCRQIKQTISIVHLMLFLTPKVLILLNSLPSQNAIYKTLLHNTINRYSFTGMNMYALNKNTACIQIPFAMCHTSKQWVTHGKFSVIHLAICRCRSVMRLVRLISLVTRKATMRVRPSNSHQVEFGTSLLWNREQGQRDSRGVCSITVLWHVMAASTIVDPANLNPIMCAAHKAQTCTRLTSSTLFTCCSTAEVAPNYAQWPGLSDLPSTAKMTWLL